MSCARPQCYELSDSTLSMQKPHLGDVERLVVQQQGLGVLGHVEEALHPRILGLHHPSSFSLGATHSTAKV